MLLFNKFPLLAEETGADTDDKKTTSTFEFDEVKMAELIKAGVKDSLKEAMSTADTSSNSQPASQSATTTTPDNPFQQWIDPLVTPRLNAATLAAQAAEDKVDFYSSDDWLIDIDEHLGSTPEEISKAKREVREEVEKTFTNMLKAGKGTFRKDILSFVMYERIKKDKAKFTETVSKRSNAKKDAELANARRAVDISTGAISNFQPQDIHAMDTAKMLEQFANVAF